MKIKSKFFKLIKNKHGVLQEQVPPPPPAPPIDPAAVPPGEEVVAAQETETITEPEPEIKQLTSEGEVELIRLILKALVVNPVLAFLISVVFLLANTHKATNNG